jgi:hypothetical protein
VMSFELQIKAKSSQRDFPTSPSMSPDVNAELVRLRLQVQSLKLKVESGIPNVSIGNYLLTRLEQLGVTVSSCIFQNEIARAYFCRRCLVFLVIST